MRYVLITVVITLFVVSLLFGVMRCGGGGGGGGTVIGPPGGTVTSSDSKATLTVPENALSSNTTISITLVGSSSLPSSLTGMDDLNLSYQLEPDGLTFAIPATFTLRLTQEEMASYLGSGGALSGTVLLTSENDELTYLADIYTSIDQDTGDYLITASISHFSYTTASNGILTMTTTPAGVSRLVSESQEVEVKLEGRSNFSFGNHGQVSEVRIKDATLKTIVPDFVTINPDQVVIFYTDDGVITNTDTFTITCNSPGDDTISFYLDRPQEYTLSTESGTSSYTIDRQFGETIPVICSDYSGFDEDTSSSFWATPNPGTAAVGSNVRYELGALIFRNHGNGSVTGTVANTSIAGPSPQTIDPFPITKYKSSKQYMSFECYEAGVTSVTFQFTLDNVEYFDDNFNLVTKTVNLSAIVPLTCTETIPAPSGVTVDDGTSCQLKVSWAYTDEFAVDGFSIEREVMGQGNWAEVATVNGSTLNYTDTAATGLQLGVTYCYRVRAYKDIPGQGIVYSEYSVDIDCGTKG